MVKFHYRSNVYKTTVNVSIHNLFFSFLMEKIELNGFKNPDLQFQNGVPGSADENEIKKLGVFA